METMKYNSFKIIFNFMDYKENNKYSSIRFETLFKNPIKIDKKKMEFNAILSEEYNLTGEYDEKIYFIPENKEFKEQVNCITLNMDMDNKYNFNINEDGDINLEIIAMWDVDYDDYEGKKCPKERKLFDIKYNGKIIEDYEKLYERKRWNILNAKVEDLEEGLFTPETLNYLRRNKNKSYKYDILLRKENNNTFLSEKKYKKIEFFSEKEKEDFKKKLEPLVHEVWEKVDKLGKKDEMEMSDPEQISFVNLLSSKMDVYISLAKSFNLYNKKWNLYNFSENDFQLFLLFSDLQIYFIEDISILYIEEVKPKYDDLKVKVLSNKNLNLIEKIRIILGFSKFVSSNFLKNFSLPELFIIKDLSENDPYKIAREKYEAIIKGLKESSGYFKKLLLNDMGSSKIINLWDFKDIKIINSLYYSKFDKMLYFQTDLKDLQKEINKKNEDKIKENKEYEKILKNIDNKEENNDHQRENEYYQKINSDNVNENENKKADNIEDNNIENNNDYKGENITEISRGNDKEIEKAGNKENNEDKKNDNKECYKKENNIKDNYEDKKKGNHENNNNENRMKEKEDDNKKENNEDCGKEEMKKDKKQENMKDNEKENNEDKDNDVINKGLIELTFPVLSMLTLNQVKKHLFDLLPKFFFKVSNNYQFNALSDSGNRITLFNETRILYLKTKKKDFKLDPNACVLPLMIEFAHEPFSHLKIRYSDISCVSPLLNPIKGKNKFLCSNDYSSESGYVMEYFLIDNYDELKHLKYRNIELFPLTNSEYWTDINFNKMKKFNKKVMEKNPMSSINRKENIYHYNFDRRSYDDDKNILCYFKKYNS